MSEGGAAGTGGLGLPIAAVVSDDAGTAQRTGETFPRRLSVAGIAGVLLALARSQKLWVYPW